MQVLLRQASDYTVKTKEVSGLDAELGTIENQFLQLSKLPAQNWFGLLYCFFSALLKVAYKSLWQVA